MYSRIRTRHLLFLAFTLVSVIPVLSLGSWLEHTAEQKEIDAVSEKHLLVARNLTGALSRYAVDLETVFRLAADRVGRGLDDEKLAEMLLGFHFRHLSSVNNEGRVLRAVQISVDKLPEIIPPRLMQTIAEGLSAEQVRFSNVTTGSSRRPAIIMSMKIAPDRFVFGEIKTDYLVELQRAITFGVNGHAAIVDRSGRVLAHPSQAWVDEMKDISMVEPVKRMMAGESGVSFFYSPAKKVDMVAGFATVPGVGWGAMIPQPILELRLHAQQITAMATRVLLLGVLVAALLSWWLAGFFAKPITALTEAARRFAADHADARIRHRGFVPRELCVLTESFNTMVADISSANRALQEKSVALAITLDNMVEGITFVDEHQRLLLSNRKFHEFFGLTRTLPQAPVPVAEVVRQMSSAGEFGRTNRTQIEVRMKQFLDVLLARDPRPFEHVRPNGQIIEMISNVLTDGGLVTSFYDITARKQADTRIQHLARHDVLTGLANRFEFGEQLQKLLACTDSKTTAAALLYIDLDEFKDVNDTLGHAVGDILLRDVAARLEICVGKNHSVARIGGDEFAIIQQSVVDREDAAQLARNVLDVISKPYTINGGELYVGAAIGITLIPDDANQADELQKNADLAMYAAKAAQRNSFRFYDPLLEVRAQERKSLEDDLRQAIARDQLSVVYQPLMELATGRITGVEALLRWRHPKRGAVAPSEFIPLAERNGLIVIIGEWVLRRACAFLRTLHREGHTALHVSVNLSTVQLRHSKCAEIVAQILRDTDLAPEFLELEITESAAMRDLESAVGILQQLDELGVSLSIDDFGTGYSSLSQLKRLPVHRVKMDGSFIHAVDQDSDNAAIVDAIIALGHSMRLPVVAECVETAEQVMFLRGRGCNEMQGYYICEPLPELELHAWLEGHLTKAPAGKATGQVRTISVRRS